MLQSCGPWMDAHIPEDAVLHPCAIMELTGLRGEEEKEGGRKDGMMELELLRVVQEKLEVGSWYGRI